MAQIGIKRISFAEKDEVDDAWTMQQAQAQAQQQQDRGTGSNPWHSFRSIDQETSTLDEELTDDDGFIFRSRLDFTIRTKSDIDLAIRYARRPVVIKVETVDGRTYTMGTREFPVWITLDNRYADLSTRELQCHAAYSTLNGIMR